MLPATAHIVAVRRRLAWEQQLAPACPSPVSIFLSLPLTLLEQKVKTVGFLLNGGQLPVVPFHGFELSRRGGALWHCFGTYNLELGRRGRVRRGLPIILSVILRLLTVVF